MSQKRKEGKESCFRRGGRSDQDDRGSSAGRKQADPLPAQAPEGAGGQRLRHRKARRPGDEVPAERAPKARTQPSDAPGQARLEKPAPCPTGTVAGPGPRTTPRPKWAGKPSVDKTASQASGCWPGQGDQTGGERPAAKRGGEGARTQPGGGAMEEQKGRIEKRKQAADAAGASFATSRPSNAGYRCRPRRGAFRRCSPLVAHPRPSRRHAVRKGGQGCRCPGPDDGWPTLPKRNPPTDPRRFNTPGVDAERSQPNVAPSGGPHPRSPLPKGVLRPLSTTPGHAETVPRRFTRWRHGYVTSGTRNELSATRFAACGLSRRTRDKVLSI